jgi:plasmid segregation protein ParM
MSIIRAIDLGYGNVKYTTASSNRSHFETGIFPSVAVPSTKNVIDTSFTSKKDIVMIDVDGQNYSVGPDSELLATNMSYRNLHDNYSSSPGYKALCLGALHYINQPVIDLLVVGLPVKFLSERSEKLREMLIGQHQLTATSNCFVRDVKVIAQPIGGFLYFLHSTNSWERLRDKTSLILDAGYYTLDWVVTKKMKTIDDRCDGNRMGASVLLNDIMHYINESKTPELDGFVMDDLNLMEQSVRNGYIELPDMNVNIAPFIKGADARIETAVADMLASIQKKSDIQNVILCGGGASFYLDVMRREFPRHNIKIAPDSVFSNIHGFQMAGEMTMARLARAS